MKRTIIILFALLPMVLYAGVIMKKSGERLEDVSIKSISDIEIVYISPSGENMTMPISEASAILYDDGRYEEIKPNASSQNASETSSFASFGGSATEINVLAYGNYIMKIYTIDHEYDGAVVEYRVLYKGQNVEPEWEYLGTAPFAYTTGTGSKSIYLTGEAGQFIDLRPLVIENYKKVKKVQFRLSKEGYQTVVVSPLIQADFTGLYYCLSLNKLKPLKGDKSDNVSSTLQEEPVTKEPIVEVPVIDPYLQYQDGQIHKLSSNRYYFVDTLYNKKELKKILLSCPETERICKNARKWIIGGWSGVAGGAALTIIGGCLIGATATSSAGRGASASYYYGTWDDPWPSFGGGGGGSSNVDVAQISGFILMGLGAGGLISSLTIACIGHHRMNNAYKVYNSSCINKPTDLSMNFGFTRNGLGMRINF